MKLQRILAPSHSVTADRDPPQDGLSAWSDARERRKHLHLVSEQPAPSDAEEEGKSGRKTKRALQPLADQPSGTVFLELRQWFNKAQSVFAQKLGRIAYFSIQRKSGESWFRKGAIVDESRE